ncbi:hypothetical protein E2C01_079428 [Portunus trituberculatus]|uniref:Uncharacterized protein n=1 Tax=Portunus trituberculatus TaxID=210409 RepID=A0A5B7IQL5_PORTR|nr:hypothetical protein [Portunus trituberculatus]
MGLTKKDKQHMKKPTEARMRKRREREDEQREAREQGERRPRLGEELRHQTADPASATPPPPPLSPTSAQPTTSKPTSRSSFKLDSVPEMEITEKSHRRYKIVDMDNLVEWARGFTRCECGKKMNIKEDLEIGNTSYPVSTCSECDKKFRMCTSTGGVTKSSGEKEGCRVPTMYTTSW